MIARSLPVSARTAFPECRNTIANAPAAPAPDPLTWRACAAALALACQAFVATPAQGQSRNTDRELQSLIPNSALDNPDAWTQSNQPPANTPPTLDPTSPLTNNAGITLPWPDKALELPQLASLPPDPDLAQARAATAAVELPQAVAGGDVEQVGSRIVLAFPTDLAQFPERTEFTARFRELSQLVSLGGSNATNIAQLAVRANTDRDLLERLLRIYGYYDATVTQSIAGLDPGQDQPSKDTKVRFDVQPGARYRFGAIDLGALPATGPDYPMLRSAFGIQSGDPLYSDHIVTARGKLDIALAENGYAFEKVPDADLLVDHRREQGDLTVPVTPGGKYDFGTIVSEMPRFLSARHLQEIARFKPGDLYKRSDVDDLRKAMYATGLVASVTATPIESRPPSDGTPGAVTLDIGMTKAKLRTIAGLVGYDSGDGFRLEGSWEHRNFFPPEGMLRLRAVAGTKEQLVGVTVRKNNFHGRDRVLTFDLYADTVQRTAYTARTLSFTATFEKLTTLIFQKPWTWGVGVELVATDEAEGVL
ncbi:MAG: outer membrane protein assembly factor, partial [Novosphingobium sp.]|nr:outer membrane protein assembly factor [Novosphingobium sp.]